MVVCMPHSAQSVPDYPSLGSEPSRNGSRLYLIWRTRFDKRGCRLSPFPSVRQFCDFSSVTQSRKRSENCDHLQQGMGTAIDSKNTLKKETFMIGKVAFTIWALKGLLGVCMPSFTHAQDTKNNLRVYTLEEIVHLSLSHNPLVKKGEAFIEKKQSQQVIAGAYPNPSLNVQSGYSEFRDSTTSITTLERYMTLSQPLEWNPKREARKQAALEGLGGRLVGKSSWYESNENKKIKSCLLKKI